MGSVLSIPFSLLPHQVTGLQGREGSCTDDLRRARVAFLERVHVAFWGQVNLGLVPTPYSLGSVIPHVLYSAWRRTRVLPGSIPAVARYVVPFRASSRYQFSPRTLMQSRVELQPRDAILGTREFLSTTYSSRIPSRDLHNPFIVLS